MAYGQLTREQNAKVASLFLNNFGLKLEEQEGLKNNSKLKILDCFNDPVGELIFDGEYIKIKTLSPLGILKAQYKRDFYNVDFDIVNGGIKYCDWGSMIDFEIYKNRDEKYRGNFITNATIDEFGNRNITAEGALNFIVDNEEISHVDFMNFGNDNFTMTIKDEVSFDQISYKHNYLSHLRRTEDGGKIDHTVCIKDGYIVVNADVSQDDNCVFKGVLAEAPVIHTKDTTKQMIRIMSEYNTALKRRVNDTRNIFKNNNCDLLSNMVASCFYLPNSNNVFEYLGLKKPKVAYQNGSDNIRDAYFGKDNSEFTLAPKMRRKLKKKY